MKNLFVKLKEIVLYDIFDFFFYLMTITLLALGAYNNWNVHFSEGESNCIRIFFTILPIFGFIMKVLLRNKSIQ